MSSTRFHLSGSMLDGTVAVPSSLINSHRSRRLGSPRMIEDHRQRQLLPTVEQFNVLIQAGQHLKLPVVPHTRMLFDEGLFAGDESDVLLECWNGPIGFDLVPTGEEIRFRSKPLERNQRI